LGEEFLSLNHTEINLKRRLAIMARLC
jgi:hypothetical protein